jgi:2'-5' RNA ligase
MERIRCFIAIELPSEIRVGLDSLEERLKTGQHACVKWVAPDGIHLTLKFLGSVASAKVSEIIEAMSRAAQGTSVIHLKMGGLGIFPNWQRPQVVWVGVGGEIDKLAALQRNIETALASLGFPQESRSFTPHLTLARLRERVTPRERQSFGEYIRSTRSETVINFEVNSLSLMRSQLIPAGAIYSRLASVKLDLKISS